MEQLGPLYYWLILRCTSQIQPAGSVPSIQWNVLLPSNIRIHSSFGYSDIIRGASKRISKSDKHCRLVENADFGENRLPPGMINSALYVIKLFHASR